MKIETAALKGKKGKKKAAGKSVKMDTDESWIDGGYEEVNNEYDDFM